MKHFIIETDKKNPLPNFINLYSKINVKNVTLGYEDKLEDYYAFQMQTTDEALVPDIITNPFLMVKREFFKTILLYMPDLKAKYISFVDTDRSNYVTYIIPILEEIERDKIKNIDISEKILFYISDFQNRYVVVRLDLLESILKRKPLGLRVQEFSTIGR